MTKEQAKKILKEVDGQLSFYLCDGQKLKNLGDFWLVLQNMRDDVFCYHSNKEKSDFSNWVKDVFVHEALAQELWLVREKRSKSEQVLNDHLNDLEKAAGVYGKTERAKILGVF